MVVRGWDSIINDKDVPPYFGQPGRCHLKIHRADISRDHLAQLDAESTVS